MPRGLRAGARQVSSTLALGITAWWPVGACAPEGMMVHAYLHPQQHITELGKGWELTAHTDVAQSHINPWANPNLLPLLPPPRKGQPGDTAVSTAGQTCTV